MKGLTVVLSRNFWPSLFFFFFSFFFPSLGSVRAFLHLLFFLFPFTLGGFFFFLHCVWFFFFFFPLGLVFSSSFFLFLFPSSITGFGLQFLLFFFFLLLSLGSGFWISFFFFFPGFDEVWVLGKKKKLHRVADMGPTNSVKNIEWWQVSDSAKRVGYFKWWVMSDGNWVMKNIDPNCP